MSLGVNHSNGDPSLVGDEERSFFARDEPWGFVMFARDAETPEQIDALTQAFRENVVRSAAVRSAAQPLVMPEPEPPEPQHANWTEPDSVDDRAGISSLFEGAFGTSRAHDHESNALPEVNNPTENEKVEPNTSLVAELADVLEIEDDVVATRPQQVAHVSEPVIPPFEPPEDPFRQSDGLRVDQKFEVTDEIASDFEQFLKEEDKISFRKQFSEKMSKVGRMLAVGGVALTLAFLGVGAGVAWHSYGPIFASSSAVSSSKTSVSGKATVPTADSNSSVASSKIKERIEAVPQQTSDGEAAETNWATTKVVKPGLTVASNGAKQNAAVAKPPLNDATNDLLTPPSIEPPKLTERFALSENDALPQSSLPQILDEPVDTFKEDVSEPAKPEVVVGADATITSTEPSSSGPASSEPSTDAAAPAVPASVAPPEPVVAKPKPAVAPRFVARATVPSKRPARRVAARPAPARAAPRPSVQTPRARRTEYSIQISAVKSSSEAQQTYANLSRQYASVIGGRGVDIRRAVVPGKGTYYRIRIPAGNRTQAVQMCARLKVIGGDCFIAR